MVTSDTHAGPAERTIRVVHSVPIWLPLTEVWLRTQIVALPGTVISHVISDRTINLDRFPIPNLHDLDRGNRVRFVVQKAVRRLGVRRDLPGAFATCRRVGANVPHSHFGPTGAANASGPAVGVSLTSSRSMGSTSEGCRETRDGARAAQPRSRRRTSSWRRGRRCASA